jgi:LacI family transcriptional regulator
MVSMKDVAKKAGVDVSTVSRVLSKKVPVSKETEQKVMVAVRELGYRANILASGLRSGSGEIIGLVVPMINNSVFSEFIHWIEIECTKRNYILIVANSHSDSSCETKFVDNIIRRYVDGIIISQVSEESEIISNLDKSNIPVVLFDRVTDVESIMTVTMDNELAGEVAANALFRSGCRKICCITGPLNIDVFKKRKKGFEKEIERLMNSGISIDYEYIECDLTLEDGELCTKKLFQKMEGMDGLWTQTDLIGAGALRFLLAKGKAIPDDIKLIGMDNTDISRSTFPSMTSISQPYKVMAEKAVEMIFNKKDNKAITDSHIVIPPEVVYRESLPLLE